VLIEEKETNSFLSRSIVPEDIFTPEDFSEEHKMIADMTEKFVVNEVMPALKKN
jgi:hypothetical protein